MTQPRIATSPDVERLIRPALRALEEYAPIVPLDELAARTGISVEQVIKLDGNENPYGASPRVAEALASLDRHIYPDPEHRAARARLADYIGLPAEHLILGNGSDELIDLVFRLVLDPGDHLINCPPTFGMYPFDAGVLGVACRDVPRTPDYALDLDAIRAAVDERTRLIVLASPNNPSGNVTPEPVIRELLELGPLVLVDEAYYEFCGQTVAPLVTRYDNLVVLRTFSKWAGLAGLRIGYGIVPQNLIGYLWKIKQPYNVSVDAQAAVVASLQDVAYLQGTVERIKAERNRLFDQLQTVSYLRPRRSEANFILCDVVGRSAKAVVEALAQAGVFVRYYDKPELKNALRISVGKPEHTDAVMAVLRGLDGAAA